MDKVLEFMAQMHELLKTRPTLCALVATDMAYVLREDGLRPYLLYVRTVSGRSLASPIGDFTDHTVAAAGGNVYDPMWHEPMPLETYLSDAFGEQADAIVSLPEQDMDAYLDSFQTPFPQTALEFPRT